MVSPAPGSEHESNTDLEERVKRTLDQDYERTGRLLQDILSENLDARINLNAIRFQGAFSTRPSFLSKLCESYLVPPLDSRNGDMSMRQLLARTRSITDKLSRFDIFTNVQARLEDSPSILAKPGDIDLVLNLQEASRVFLRTATDVGNGEGSATITGRVRNLFGGAETLEANAAYGTRTKSSYQVRLEAPVLSNPDSRVELSGYAVERDLSFWASCKEHLQGGSLKWKLSNTPYGFQEVAYEAIVRRLYSFEPHASMSMRSSGGHNLKSAISHTVISDTRNDPFAATSGRLLRLYQEYAGLAGDARHYKVEGESQFSREVFPGHSVSLAARMGLLWPLGGGSHFSDRFQLGGPTSVRNFKLNHIGPKDNGDYIGGDLSYSGGISFLTPFYPKPEWPLKGHLFLNVGNLAQWQTNKSGAHVVQDWLRQPSISAGVGLMFRHSQVRIEANVGVPLVAHRTDGPVKGFQFGLGLSFL